MKSIYLTLALLFTLSTFAQKKNINGKIYDKHPAIDLVDQFTSAFVKGDSAAITNLVSENFGWWQMNEMRPRKRTLNNLLNRSKYLSNNVIGFNLKNRGSIKVGNIADIVVWEYDPLEPSSMPEKVIINGIDTDLTNRSTRLRDRYIRDLEKPNIYRN